MSEIKGSPRPEGTVLIGQVWDEVHKRLHLSDRTAHNVTAIECFSYPVGMVAEMTLHVLRDWSFVDIEYPPSVVPPGVK